MLWFTIITKKSPHFSFKEPPVFSGSWRRIHSFKWSTARKLGGKQALKCWGQHNYKSHSFECMMLYSSQVHNIPRLLSPLAPWCHLEWGSRGSFSFQTGQGKEGSGEGSHHRSFVTSCVFLASFPGLTQLSITCSTASDGEIWAGPGNEASVFHYLYAMMKSYLKEGLLQKKCMLRRVKEINNDEIPCNQVWCKYDARQYKFVCIDMLWTFLYKVLLTLDLSSVESE